MGVTSKDLIVQQLLEERRKRLQLKLYGDNGADADGTDRAGLDVIQSGGGAFAARSAVSTNRDLLKGDDFIVGAGGLGDDVDAFIGDDCNIGGREFRNVQWNQEPVAAEFNFAGCASAVVRGNSGNDRIAYDHPFNVDECPDDAPGSNSRTSAATDLAAHRRVQKVGGSGGFAGGATLQHARGTSPSPQQSQTRSRPRSAPPARMPRTCRERALSSPKVPPPTQERRHDFSTKVQEWQLRHQAFLNKQHIARREKESQELQECTFRPSINSRSEFYARRSRGCYVESLPERLHHEADKRAMLRQKAKELVEADAMFSYTFHPEINRKRTSSSSAAGGARTPIHLRTEELMQRKQEKSKAAQAAHDARSQCSFQPRISERSERLVQKRRDEIYRAVSQGDQGCVKMLGPVEERLYAEARDKQQRRAARTDSISEDSVSAPSVDEESRRICKSSVYFQGAQQDFLTRQQTFELAKQRRMEVRAQRADAKCPFKPEISETSRHIVESNMDYLGETPEDRVNRLAVQDAERREHIRDALEQLHYRECTFRPTLNPTSQYLVSRIEDEVASEGTDGSQPVHERLFRSAQQRVRIQEDPVGGECTFRPQLETNPRFAHVKGRYSIADGGSKIMDNIREEMDHREEQLMQRRIELEENERSECTFTPDTRRPCEKPSRPVAVSGLGRFFELRGLAQRKQREQEEREARAFQPEVHGTRCGGATIPEPFNLSGGDGGTATLWKKHPPDPGECTFAPRTIESEKRELIRQLVGSTAPLPFR